MRRVPSSMARMAYRVSVLDVAAAALAPLTAMLLRDPDYFSRAEGMSIGAYSALAVAATLVGLVRFRIGQILDRYLSGADLLQLTKTAATGAILTAVLAFTFTRLDGVPRSLPVLHFLVLAAMLVGHRALRCVLHREEERRAAPRAPQSAENLLLVGATRLAQHYIRLLACLPEPRPRVVALLDERRAYQGRSVCGHLVAGGLADASAVLGEFATHGVPVHRIVIAYADPRQRLLAEEALADLCAARGVRLDFMADRLHSGPPPADETAAERAAPTPPAIAARYLRLRRALDLVAAGVLTLFLAPVFLVVALLVLLDVGAPTVFWQERVGRFGRPIAVYKFRTLRAPIDRQGRRVPESERLSGLGRALRATRMDELPQLWNILIGDMSLIGPRPLLPADLAPGATTRHQVRPGVTGWAQVNGGKLVTAQEKNALDEWYIDHVSWRVDLRIVRLTLLAPFRGDRRREKAVVRALRYREQRLAGAAAPKADVAHREKAGGVSRLVADPAEQSRLFT